MEEGNPQKSKASSKSQVIATVIVLGLIIVGFIYWIQSPDTPESQGPKPTFEAAIDSYTVQDPATIRVVVKVKNVGSVSGSPTCTVNVGNATKTYSGFDTFGPGKTLAPGEEWGFNGLITITKEGAEYVTEGGATCT